MINHDRDVLRNSRSALTERSSSKAQSSVWILLIKCRLLNFVPVEMSRAVPAGGRGHDA